MTLLLLAGTAEARRIAAALAERVTPVIASLAGATRNPLDLGVPTRSGGFGGSAGFESFIRDRGISAVLDATHPFASRISHRTARICAQNGLPYLQVLREPWIPNTGDDWVFLESEDRAAEHVPPGSTVFLATGLQNLCAFANLNAARVYARRIDEPREAFPFPGGTFLRGRPPFSVKDEVALFWHLEIDWLIVKNSGGVASRTKLDAARELSIKVALINRPAQPDAPRVATVDAALDWVERLM